MLFTAPAESKPAAILLLSPVTATLVVVVLAETSVAHVALDTLLASVANVPQTVNSLLSPVMTAVTVVSVAVLMSTSNMLLPPVAV